MLRSKAQVSGAPAASLIIAVMAFVLIFILLLPSEDRDELLRNNDDDSVISEPGEKFGILLQENPGTLTKLKEREFDHNIPSFNLIVEREDAVLKRVGSVFVESSGQPSRSILLFVQGKAENGRLTFKVEDHSGKLTIRFNDGDLFKGEIERVVDPLALNNIKQENLIEFLVDRPPAWMFWQKNFYDIRDLTITATIENLENQESINTFFMSKEEADIENIEDAFIRYFADCKIGEVGKLTVQLNGNLLSSKVPDCGSLEKTFIDPADFVEGKNEITFFTNEGKYLIDQVRIKTQLKKPVFPVFFFDLNSSQFAKVENNTINASIIMEFIDDVEKKNAIIEINNHKIFLDTRQKVFAKNIDLFVVEGSNFIRIEPERTLHVIELKVQLDCKTKKDCA